MKTNSRIAWSIWMENLTSDLIQSQVIRILTKLAGTSESSIYLFWFIRPWGMKADESDLKKIKTILQESGVQLITIPMVILPRRFDAFFLHWFTSLIVTPLTSLAMLFFCWKYAIQTMHVRSYPAMPSALLVKLIIRPLNIIFDTRSPFPEESVSSGRWKPNSITYKYWKWIEKKSVTAANATLVVSNAHSNQLRTSIHSYSNVFVFRNNADVVTDDKSPEAKFLPKNSIDDTLNDSVIRFIYVGSLPSKSWNNPTIYADLAEILVKSKRDFYITFLTRDQDSIFASLDERKIPRHLYEVKSCSPNEVVNNIRSKGIGLNLMKTRDVRMSVKTAEYIAAGIPIICTDTVSGAVELIDEFKIGRVIDSVDGVLGAADSIIRDLPKIRENLLRAQASISSDMLVTKLISVYKQGHAYK